MVRGSKEFQQHWLIKHGRRVAISVDANRREIQGQQGYVVSDDA